MFVATFGSGRPLVLLHGGMANADWWGFHAERLSRSHRIVTMDTRGHGRSPPASAYSYDLFAADALHVLDALTIRKAAIAGWSDGGITALRLAMIAPDRIETVFAFGANVTPDGYRAGGAASPPFASYAARCKAEYTKLAPRPEGWSDLVRGLRALWRREPNYRRESLGLISVPVTIASAGHDEIIKPEHARLIATSIPRARLVTFPNVSHFAIVQDRDGFLGALETWLGG